MTGLPSATSCLHTAKPRPRLPGDGVGERGRAGNALRGVLVARERQAPPSHPDERFGALMQPHMIE